MDRAVAYLHRVGMNVPQSVLDRSVEKPWELNEFGSSLAPCIDNSMSATTSTRSLSPCSIWTKNSVFGATDMSRWLNALSGSPRNGWNARRRIPESHLIQAGVSRDLGGETAHYHQPRRSRMSDRKLYIDGKFCSSSTGDTLRTLTGNGCEKRYHPRGELEMSIESTSGKGCSRGPWGTMPQADRLKLLAAAADGIRRRFDDFLAAEPKTPASRYRGRVK